MDNSLEYNTVRLIVVVYHVHDSFIHSTMHPSIPIHLWCRRYPITFFAPRCCSYSLSLAIYAITSSRFTSHASHIHDHVFDNAILFLHKQHSVQSTLVSREQISNSPVFGYIIAV